MLSMDIKNRFAGMFTPYSCYQKPIEANGHLERDGSFYINYSDILTRLIQEAGRYCERYASDLFIDWKIVDDDLKNGMTITQSKLFGFRESGVDHVDFVYGHLSNPYGNYEYRSIWRLDIEVTDDDYYGKEIKMSLYRVLSPTSWDLKKFYDEVKKEQEVCHGE